MMKTWRRNPTAVWRPRVRPTFQYVGRIREDVQPFKCPYHFIADKANDWRLHSGSGVPFIFVHIPFYVCILAPLMNITVGLFNTYLPYLFALYPVLNPLIVFYFVADIRNYVVQKLKIISCLNRSQVHALKLTASSRK
ncbi:unnamed protein product [Angiostrongylus costaricensis]|uniref:G_PROTEIN_RECEP_F1_2 domain-containing protein n=1 Tax=Angiostrongylus costaricensis TaxID=334426 RepID=A0A0R3Q1N4_ANGCS|nr:unnamed protein product [Angiostrongylus costaricensis]